MGEYVDGTHLSEFDFLTKQENSFYSIRKDKLIRFGLIGHGMKLYFEADGLFKLSGRMVELLYVTPEKEYRLNGRMDIPYNDIITYKDAISSGLANYSPAAAGEGGALSTKITQYSFGYKNIIQDGDVAFNFKALCRVPAGDPVYMNFRLVSNQALDGKFQIRVNGLVVSEFHAPLEPMKGGELNWVVQ